MRKRPGGLHPPKPLDPLSVSLDNNSSFSLSDTGHFAKEDFAIGPHGITESPLSHGEISTLRLDQLRVDGMVGRGASSRVYAATHKPSSKRVALKVLQEDIEDSRESRHMVLNEIKMVFNACSDHLVAFYDAFFDNGSIYLALEFMDRGSLEGLLGAVGSTPMARLPESVLASILFQMTQGLTYLHRERRSVHRDLKPANVLLNACGFVKLSDFGISKELGTGTYAQAGTQVGTLAYMSPERVRGEHYGYASDVWSFGMIALEAALGAYPYPAELCKNYFDLVQTIVDGPLPTETPAVRQTLAADGREPHELIEFVHACMGKAAHTRPDVISLTRFPFLARHLSEPVDLRAFLSGLHDYTQQAQAQAQALPPAQPPPPTQQQYHQAYQPNYASRPFEAVALPPGMPAGVPMEVAQGQGSAELG